MIRSACVTEVLSPRRTHAAASPFHRRAVGLIRIFHTSIVCFPRFSLDHHSPEADWARSSFRFEDSSLKLVGLTEARYGVSSHAADGEFVPRRVGTCRGRIYVFLFGSVCEISCVGWSSSLDRFFIGGYRCYDVRNILFPPMFVAFVRLLAIIGGTTSTEQCNTNFRGTRRPPWTR